MGNGTTMAFPGLLEGQRNQPKPHADLFSEVMVKTTFDQISSAKKVKSKNLLLTFDLASQKSKVTVSLIVFLFSSEWVF